MKPFTPQNAGNIKVHVQMKGHQNLVTDACFSPDGSALASISRDGTLRLWDTQTGKQLGILKEGLENALDILYTADGKTLITAQHDGIHLWNGDTGDEAGHLAGHQDSVTSLALSPDGKRLVSGSRDNSVKLWDVNTHEEITTLAELDAPVVKICCTSQVIAALAGKNIYLWEADSNELLDIIDNQKKMISIALSETKIAVLLGERDKTTLQFYNLSDRQSQGDPIPSRFLMRAAFSPDGNVLATSSADVFEGLRLWDPDDGTLLTGQAGGTLLVFSPQGEMIATGGMNTIQLYAAQKPTSTKIYSTGEGLLHANNIPLIKGIGALRGHSDSVTCLSFHPHDPLLASSGKDRTVRLWDIDNGKEILSLKGHQERVTGVDFSPDGKTLLSVESRFAAKTVVRFWAVDSWDEIGRLRIEQSGGSSNCNAVFSPDGKLLAVGAALYNASTGEKIFDLGSHRAGVNQCAFNAEGSLVAIAVGSDTGYSGQEDNAVKVYDTTTGEETTVYRKHKDWVVKVAFTRSLQHIGELVNGVDIRGQLWGWDVESQRLIAGGDGITALVVSPSGDLMVAANVDNTLRLLDIGAGGGDGRQLDGHEARILDIAFSRDGKLMASCGEDNDIHLWGVPANGE